MSKFYIKVNDEMFIDEVILEGNEEELSEKMQNIEFVNSLDIHESFLYEKFSLVPVDDVDFPEYVI